MTYKLPDPLTKWPSLEPLYSEAQVLQAYRDGLDHAAGLTEALEHIIRRLQMDIEDGSRPDQWSMEDLVSKARKAIKAFGEQA